MGFNMAQKEIYLLRSSLASRFYSAEQHHKSFMDTRGRYTKRMEVNT